jgi:hypothetical protein
MPTGPATTSPSQPRPHLPPDMAVRLLANSCVPGRTSAGYARAAQAIGNHIRVTFSPRSNRPGMGNKRWRWINVTGII